MKRTAEQLDRDADSFTAWCESPLTTREEAVLEFITDFIEWNRVPPSLIGIVRAPELKYHNALPLAVIALAMKRRIELAPELPGVGDKFLA